MTDQRTGNKKVRDRVADIILEQLDLYFGAEEKLTTLTRSLWVFLGATTMFAMKFAWRHEDPLAQISGRLHELSGLLDVTTIMTFAIIVVSPIVLAVAVAKSMRKGNPVRFFFIGFFVYGFVLTFATWPENFEPDDVRSPAEQALEQDLGAFDIPAGMSGGVTDTP